VHGTEARTVRIVYKGDGRVTAGDIVTDPNVEILNPEHHIASCSMDANLEINGCENG
jgi:DNA-directed RNA polymerase subunit alpha